MNKRIAPSLVALGVLATQALPALAHPGHGIPEPHWHGTEAAGIVVAVVALCAFMWWRSKR